MLMDLPTPVINMPEKLSSVKLLQGLRRQFCQLNSTEASCAYWLLDSMIDYLLGIKECSTLSSDSWHKFYYNLNGETYDE